jgi:Cytotoxic translational repressor of toxin-antitoxin stability system
MTYDVSFAGGVEAALQTLSSDAAAEIKKKLNEVATSEWRSPTDWGYEPWNGGQAGGKYNWGSYRVFADIDEENETIIIREARSRENLYR